MGWLRSIAERLSAPDALRRDRDGLRTRLAEYERGYPPGHFSSPIPSLDDVRARADVLFDRTRRDLPGVDLQEAEQLALFDALVPFYEQQPFTGQPGNLRYHFDNPWFSYADAIFLHCLIRHARPRRIIEVGSGYSSCVILDTNDLYFEGAIECTCIRSVPTASPIAAPQRR